MFECIGQASLGGRRDYQRCEHDGDNSLKKDYMSTYLCMAECVKTNSNILINACFHLTLLHVCLGGICFCVQYVILCESFLHRQQHECLCVCGVTAIKYF